MTRRVLWVVEMMVLDGSLTKQWEPTTCVTFTRADGKPDIARCRREWPFDRFRLVKYLPQEK